MDVLTSGSGARTRTFTVLLATLLVSLPLGATPGLPVIPGFDTGTIEAAKQLNIEQSNI